MVSRKSKSELLGITRSVFAKIKKLNLNWFRLGLLIIVIVVLMPVFEINLSNNSYINSLPIAGSATPTPLYQDFHLIIDKIQVNAPVIADVDGNDKKGYFKALENGVAHLKNSAKPGENSNVFIFGHSSFYWYSPGDYKEIFRDLEDLQIGDQITIWYKEKQYLYFVSNITVVQPADVEVSKPTQTEQITLMTCVPVGTNDKRLIVTAKPKN